MDKKTAGMDKRITEPLFWVTPKPKENMPEFLQQYGLWIFTWHMDHTSSPGKPGVYRYYEFYSFSHMHAGSGWFATDEAPFTEMFPGDAVLVAPGFRHGYRGYKDHYIEDSVSFFGPLADRMALAGMIPNQVFHLGKNRRLLPIIELLRDPSLASQYQANMMLQQLLLDIFLKNRSGTVQDCNIKLELLLTEIQGKPAHWWTVEEMAEFCELSKSRFRQVFQTYTGMLPKEYLQQSKIKYAASLLISSACQVQEAAALTGFSDPFHFSRVFKAVTGLSPSNYIATFHPE